jgi:hypothetical protein
MYSEPEIINSKLVVEKYEDVVPGNRYKVFNSGKYMGIIQVTEKQDTGMMEDEIIGNYTSFAPTNRTQIPELRIKFQNFNRGTKLQKLSNDGVVVGGKRHRKMTRRMKKKGKKSRGTRRNRLRSRK